MRCKLFGIVQLVCLLGILNVAAAQQQKGGGQSASQTGGQAGQQSQGAGSGGSQGLTGLTYTPAEWPQLRLPDPKGPATSFSKGRIVVCYRMVRSNSATQPFVLERVAPDELAGSGFDRPCGDVGNGSQGETDGEGKKLCTKLARKGESDPRWNPCTELQKDKTPLLMNQELVIGIDVSDIGNLGWNNDQLKLLNFNVTNQQSAPLNPTPLRPSFPGTASAGGGGGSAGSNGLPAINDSRGGGNLWIPIGAYASGGIRSNAWKPNFLYHDGDIVSDSAGRRFYRAKAGSRTDKSFDSGDQPGDPFPPEPRVERTLDGDILWQEMSRPGVNIPATRWVENHEYAKSAVVCVVRGAGDLAPDIPHMLQMTVSNDRIGKREDYLASVQWSGISPFTEASGTQDSVLPAATADAEKACKDIKLLPDPKTGKTGHLHYYFAVNQGTSGGRPVDPFSIALIPRAVYLEWPYEIPGDVIPTFNVNLVYTPPTPGAFWQANAFYPAGSVVIPRVNNGHYYTALSGGVSGVGDSEPKFPPQCDVSQLAPNSPPDCPREIKDGTLVWLDTGPTAPAVPSSPGGGNQSSASGGGGGQSGGGGQGGGAGGTGGGATKPQLRFPSTHYLLGDVITVPQTGHYYTVVQSDAGFSGPQSQAQSLPGGGSSGLTDPFPKTPGQAQTLIDGDVLWALENAPIPNPLPPSLLWQSGHPYSKRDHMVPRNGSYYIMVASSVTSGNSGTPFQWPQNPQPNFVQQDGIIEWMYDANGAATADWRPQYPYTVGATVYDGRNRVYRMIDIITGKSGSLDPSIGNGTTLPATVTDGDLLWADLGIGPAASTTQPWKPLFPYAVGQTARSLVNGHDYQVIRFIGGLSGPQENLSFPILQSGTIVDPRTEIKDTGIGALSWLDLGQVAPADLRNWEPKQWAPNSYYQMGQTIFVPRVGNGRYYRARNIGYSGTTSPFLNLTPPYPITWQDAGTTAPASVSSGQPVDQTVSLINLTLPQTHSLSYFNIAAGVILDFKTPRVFGWVPASSYTGLPSKYVGSAPTSTTSGSYAVDPTTGCTVSTVANPLPPNSPPGTQPTYNAYECPTQVSTGPKPVDPVLVLTGYFPPIDAEVPWRLRGKDWWRDALPGPSLGISLSNPTSNFYLGGSNEFLIRNLQLFYGAAFHNIPTSLAPGSTQPLWGGTGTAPSIVTVSRLQKGFFFGATFNLSGFIQSLFGGGGAKGQ